MLERGVLGKRIETIPYHLCYHCQNGHSRCYCDAWMDDGFLFLAHKRSITIEIHRNWIEMRRILRQHRTFISFDYMHLWRQHIGSDIGFRG